MRIENEKKLGVCVKNFSDCDSDDNASYHSSNSGYDWVLIDDSDDEPV